MIMEWLLNFILYFPENKIEYLYGFLQMIPFIILAVVAIIFFKKISRKEEEKANELLKKLSENEKKRS